LSPSIRTGRARIDSGARAAAAARRPRRGSTRRSRRAPGAVDQEALDHHGQPDLGHPRAGGLRPDLAALADQVLAHGISTAFQLAVVFAALALAVALAVVRTGAPQAAEAAQAAGS
jgi:hypothetical protein